MTNIFVSKFLLKKNLVSRLRINGLWLLLALLALMGCDSKGSIDELRRYAAEVKQRPAKPIEPVPVMKPAPKYTYPDVTKRDPFQLLGKYPVATAEQKFWPNMNRSKEPLEAYPLDALRMVGLIKQDAKVWALVSVPEGAVVRITLGNYLGQNYGRVVSITDKAVQVMERVPDGDEWINRPALMTLDTNESGRIDSGRNH